MEKKQYEFSTRVKLSAELCFRIRDAMERMCDLPWSRFSEEACRNLYLKKKSGNPPCCYIFDPILDMRHDGNIIGTNAGYTYWQIYHARLVIRMVIDDRQVRCMHEANAKIAEAERERIKSAEEVWEILNNIGLEWTAPIDSE